MPKIRPRSLGIAAPSFALAAFAAVLAGCCA
jgi:hypothetical protein